MNLTGKKICFLGDSITEGAGASAKEKCYVSLFAAAHPEAEVHNFGIGGTRIAKQTAPSENPRWDLDFVSRVPEMPENVDLVCIFGGTNDSWIGNEAGKLQFENWTDETLLQVLPAACYMLDYITTHNPNAAILFILNSELREEITEGLASACAHYGVKVLRLKDISKQNGHPDILGMQQIARQVDQALNEL